METRDLGLGSLAAVVALGMAASACGGASEMPATADDAPATSDGEAPAAPKGPAQADAASEDEEEEEDEPQGMPTKCAKKGSEFCTPPKKWVKRLCSGFYPDVALAMFAKGTPWTRAYLAANVTAWNASGGASSEGELKFDEEVLVVMFRKASTDGMQVSGAGDSFDVLRWDGTCATLSSEEITTNTPPKPLNAMVTWKDLDPGFRAGLLDDEGLQSINKARKKECKGVSMGAVSKKCVKLVNQQSDDIVSYVRNGGAIPTPTKLP